MVHHDPPADEAPEGSQGNARSAGQERRSRHRRWHPGPRDQGHRPVRQPGNRRRHRDHGAEECRDHGAAQGLAESALIPGSLATPAFVFSGMPVRACPGSRLIQPDEAPAASLRGCQAAVCQTGSAPPSWRATPAPAPPTAE
ncbi:hypothetical protein CBM2615_A280243 [Cupriavidus taiwanensis]|uniref:Uncharacterized protein n=1 Tax=Cupriavidus taiwanensis TaxID=164546 RepID=A0A976AWK6_9BURK|nr:hypothetical protein CBM2615_A280243 [Cupriavidus taiwanensis]SOZ57141.1 hypothetical protein CBM2614_A250247 [Cupriavidus taiwanensis]SOZ59566.1 hypothetical protein CBM2613_A250244 [Cupriavidus taiwanensis]SPA05722.1 hypothetical protein CBM2625_A200247 [Cupriavidus taiwanensis]